MSEHRNWTFTFNNWKTNYNEAKEFIVKINALSKYWIYGKETAPTTGMKHLQGYVEFKSSKSLNTLKSYSKKVHWEVAKGSRYQNYIYCSKDKRFKTKKGCEESHLDTRQGKRNDIETARNILSSGGNLRQVLNTVNSYQACRFAEFYRKYSNNYEDVPKKIIWIYGKSGVGKTRYVWKQIKDRSELS